MGIRFILDCKWGFPVDSPLKSTSPIRHLSFTSSARQQHSSSSYYNARKGREDSFESARVSTLSVIPEESDFSHRESLRPNMCSYGYLQNVERNGAALEMQMNKEKKESHVEVSSRYLVNLPENNTHLSFLMENVEKIEEIVGNSDLVTLEREILTQIGRLGALNLFHACLSRSLKSPVDLSPMVPLTWESKGSPLQNSVDAHMDKVIVRSGKKTKRKMKRERISLKGVEKSASSVSLETTHKIYQTPSKLSSPISRRLSIARNESELSRGVKEVANLEKIRTSLEERIGHVSFSRWADAAGINEKVLQQHLRVGWNCRDKLLKSTRSLILFLARNYRGRGIGLEDLLQAGYIGVLQGAERFDHTRGYRFSTYVQYWIRKSMSTFVARHSRGIQMPVSLSNTINKTAKARRALHNQRGKYPPDEEIANVTGISLANVRLATKCSRVVGSTYQRVGDARSFNFLEITPDMSMKTPEEIVMRQHMIKEIYELLEELHPRQRQVLILRFGLGDGRCKSLEEIGRLFNVSKEWIRKIEKSAMAKVNKKRLQTRFNHYLHL